MANDYWKMEMQNFIQLYERFKKYKFQLGPIWVKELENFIDMNASMFVNNPDCAGLDQIYLELTKV